MREANYADAPGQYVGPNSQIVSGVKCIACLYLGRYQSSAIAHLGNAARTKTVDE